MWTACPCPLLVALGDDAAVLAPLGRTTTSLDHRVWRSTPATRTLGASKFDFHARDHARRLEAEDHDERQEDGAESRS